jgi:nucleoside 2-deoxyribosyltransferase
VRIYISGPMTGLPDWNIPAFQAAAAALRAAGHDVASPVEIGKAAGLDENTAPWEAFIREDLRQIIDVDGVALLPGWHNSRGAALEVQVACALKLPIHPIEKWTEADAA